MGWLEKILGSKQPAATAVKTPGKSPGKNKNSAKKTKAVDAAPAEDQPAIKATETSQEQQVQLSPAHIVSQWLENHHGQLRFNGDGAASIGEILRQNGITPPEFVAAALYMASPSNNPSAVAEQGHDIAAAAITQPIPGIAAEIASDSNRPVMTSGKAPTLGL